MIKFEEGITDLYKEGKIPYPIHLSGGNEKQLSEIFRFFEKGDWVFTTYRSHYHWLLSGRDSKELKNKIVNTGSMNIYDDKFFTSAIVGGHVPIAVGTALALKMKGSSDKVWCFMGDMAATTGIVKESIRYAEGFELPITFVIEDNGLSVNTPTETVWGDGIENKVITYDYKRNYPHSGTGEYVLF